MVMIRMRSIIVAAADRRDKGRASVFLFDVPLLSMLTNAVCRSSSSGRI